ncbi:uncharacterized protein Dwil_GK22104 [Drosophila willistoni]|uniref:Odorant receptor n=1 Tax=Drosophila willistoni TaxID=7260 RepID=B4MYB7_DROWI|nr:odorant receptor 47b [Drosophila willistoni]EDW77106.1 uncharacterized protein Dwil_GK22104 [Drosophila willistoni]
MSEADYKSNVRLVSGFFDEFLSVLKKKSRPPRLVLHYHRACLCLLFIYPNKKMTENSVYRQCNLVILANLTFFLITVMSAIHESKNVIDMGEDFVWIIGISLILTKIFYIYLRADGIDSVIEDFDYYGKLRPHNNDEEILRWQRLCYLAESGIFINCFVLLTLFNLAICVQPLIGGGDLPFHVMYPNNWHRRQIHPKVWSFIYIWQSITSHHNLMSILQIDLLGIHTFLQTALNLKILCLEMRKLGKFGKLNDDQFHQEFSVLVKFHQHVISTVQKNNRVFYGSFITQMIASFALISMSTFETMAAAGDPKVAAKFVLFMVITFIQLSYWCLAGTLVYTQSMEVAQAAFDIQDWHTKSVSIQRDIMFVIQRSQKPLMYVAQPFMPFTLTTYTMILKQCYRILALLRESM